MSKLFKIGYSNNPNNVVVVPDEERDKLDFDNDEYVMIKYKNKNSEEKTEKSIVLKIKYEYDLKPNTILLNKSSLKTLGIKLYKSNPKVSIHPITNVLIPDIKRVYLKLADFQFAQPEFKPYLDQDVILNDFLLTYFAFDSHSHVLTEKQRLIISDCDFDYDLPIHVDVVGLELDSNNTNNVSDQKYGYITDLTEFKFTMENNSTLDLSEFMTKDNDDPNVIIFKKKYDSKKINRLRNFLIILTFAFSVMMWMNVEWHKCGKFINDSDYF